MVVEEGVLGSRTYDSRLNGYTKYAEMSCGSGCRSAGSVTGLGSEIEGDLMSGTREARAYSWLVALLPLRVDPPAAGWDVEVEAAMVVVDVMEEQEKGRRGTDRVTPNLH